MKRNTERAFTVHVVIKKEADKVKAAKGNGAGRGRPIGAQYKIKELLLQNPKMSVEDLLKKLAPLGFKPTRAAVASIRSGFRQSMKVIMDKGGIPKGTEL